MNQARLPENGPPVSAWRTSARAASLPFETVEAMARALKAQTAECLMETFGISRNTWDKLKRGQPVRTSVVNRLVSRLEAKGFVFSDAVDA